MGGAVRRRQGAKILRPLHVANDISGYLLYIASQHFVETGTMVMRDRTA